MVFVTVAGYHLVDEFHLCGVEYPGSDHRGIACVYAALDEVSKARGMRLEKQPRLVSWQSLTPDAVLRYAEAFVNYTVVVRVSNYRKHLYRGIYLLNGRIKRPYRLRFCGKVLSFCRQKRTLDLQDSINILTLSQFV